ncbi:hypothetical protein WJX73_005552 [Symbiochloris irregularis]|uniref:Uncharacterized protein n=1 Tax=Symbiochloris irregularis TaxID=706552 RepID=A0AAW1NLN8_9CHLO
MGMGAWVVSLAGFNSRWPRRASSETFGIQFGIHYPCFGFTLSEWCCLSDPHYGAREEACRKVTMLALLRPRPVPHARPSGAGCTIALFQPPNRKVSTQKKSKAVFPSLQDNSASVSLVSVTVGVLAILYKAAVTEAALDARISAVEESNKQISADLAKVNAKLDAKLDILNDRIFSVLLNAVPKAAPPLE